MKGAWLRGSRPPMATLFMVPWEAAGTAPGRAVARAARITSTMRWEVSTLPPATAAGKVASRRLPRLVRTVMGRRQPALVGASGVNETELAKVAAACVANEEKDFGLWVSVPLRTAVELWYAGERERARAFLRAVWPARFEGEKPVERAIADAEEAGRYLIR